MYRFLILISGILITASLFSCEEDSFSQVVEIDIPSHQALPVLSAHLTDRDTTFFAAVSLSKGILEANDPGFFLDAAVRMLLDGEPYIDFQAAPESYVLVAERPVDFEQQAGRIFRLEAEVPGFRPIYAEQKYPAKVALENFTFEKLGTINDEGERAHEYIIEFTDPPENNNYYGVTARIDYRNFNENTGEYSRLNSWPIYLHSNLPHLIYGNRYSLLMRDDSFNGKKQILSLWSHAWFGTKRHEKDQFFIHLSLYSLTEEAFLYDSSLQAYRDAQGNPFAEPVTVFNNVTNGYGIFTLASISSIVFEIE